MSKLTSSARAKYAAMSQEGRDSLILQASPVHQCGYLRLEIAELETERAVLRARVAELEATAGAYKASVEALQDAMADIGEDGDLWTFEDRHAAARDALATALAKLPEETT